MTPAPAFPAQCVVDASVLIKVVLHEPHSALARQLLVAAPLDARVVPDLAYTECASVLVTSFRRRILTLDQARAGLLVLYRVPLTSYLSTPLLGTALDLATALDISAYDAMYVALAEALDVPLITADTTLAARVGGLARTLADYADSPA